MSEQSTRRETRGRVPAVAAVALVILAGCGANDAQTNPPTPTVDTSSPAVSVAFNETDVYFAREMIPHHEQAVEMASLAEAAGASPEVMDLANRIYEAQRPEIETMAALLIAWGEEVPEGLGGTGHGGMGHEQMPGMMTDEEMDALSAAHGAEFDFMFLAAMIAHHDGAILMAQVEHADGENPDALDLATRIETSQAAEITEMQRLLGSQGARPS